MTWYNFFCGAAFTASVLYAINYRKKKQAQQKVSADNAIKRHSSLPHQLSVKRGFTHDPNNFLSLLIKELWGHLNPAIGSIIEESVQTVLDDLPGSIRFTKFDLGEAPIEFLNIVVHEAVDDALKMDLDLYWNGDSDIDLEMTGGVTLGIDKIKFAGRLSILFYPLIHRLPIVSAIQYAFINPPFLDLNFTGAVDIIDQIGLHDKILDFVRFTVNDIVVLPTRMNVILDEGTNLMSIYQQPTGMARITVVKGRGFEVIKGILDDIPDCYCNIRFGVNDTWSTSVQNNNMSPEWNEQHDYLYSEGDQIIHIDVYDQGIASDTFLGRARVTINEIEEAEGTLEVLLQDNDLKPTGSYVTISCKIFHLTPRQDSFELPLYKGKNLLCGHAGILIAQAINVPEKYHKTGTSIKVTCGKTVFNTGVVMPLPEQGVDAKNPVYKTDYNSIFHLPLTQEMLDKTNTKGGIVFTLMNGSTEIGTHTVAHQSVMDLPSNWFNQTCKIGDEGVSFEFSVSILGLEAPPTVPVPSSRGLRGIQLPESMKTSHRGDEGLLEVKIGSGRGFKVNKSWLKKDIPDLYCKVTLKSTNTVWRTKTIKDDTEPKWNESNAFHISNDYLNHDILRLDVLDENKKNDKYLGYAEIKVKDLLRNSGKSKEVELLRGKDGRGADTYITLSCKELALSMATGDPSTTPVSLATRDVIQRDPVAPTKVDAKISETVTLIPQSDLDKSYEIVSPITSPCPSVGAKPIKFRLTTVSGHGFKTHKKILHEGHTRHLLPMDHWTLSRKENYRTKEHCDTPMESSS